MKKFIVTLVCVFIILAGICIGVGFSFDYKKIDMVYVNEVLQCLDNGTTPENIVYDYSVVSSTGEIKYSKKEVENYAFEVRISKALANGDIVVEHGDDKVIFYLLAKENYFLMRNMLIIAVVIAIVIIAILMAVGCYLIYARTIKPFNKLKDFAFEVSKGNLDSPLILDKYMSFGVFGEAFDIMRNNLRESRISEQNEMLEKRRLIQEIGHEIKTPLSTIKAVAECGMAVKQDSNFGIIADKVNVIDNMVNDFYQKALEEDGELKIYLTKHSCNDLKKLIAESDYNNKITFEGDADCNVLYDKNRMTQIIDNIIVNSYKYADTDIKVTITTDEQNLKVKFKDFGEGVVPEQISYIMERFYRGEKTAEKMGQGLGLNISRRLIVRMGGDMTCYNDNGFVAELILPIYKGNFIISSSEKETRNK